MHFESLQGAVMRIHARELHFGTEIRASAAAREAFCARHLRLDGDAVALVHLRDARPDLEHDAGAFVA